MNNTLGDLNNHLFAQLEKLGDDDVSGEELETEIKRADAMAKLRVAARKRRKDK